MQRKIFFLKAWNQTDKQRIPQHPTLPQYRPPILSHLTHSFFCFSFWFKRSEAQLVELSRQVSPRWELSSFSKKRKKSGHNVWPVWEQRICRAADLLTLAQKQCSAFWRGATDGSSRGSVLPPLCDPHGEVTSWLHSGGHGSFQKKEEVSLRIIITLWDWKEQQGKQSGKVRLTNILSLVRWLLIASVHGVGLFLI